MLNYLALRNPPDITLPGAPPVAGRYAAPSQSNASFSGVSETTAFSQTGTSISGRNWPEVIQSKTTCWLYVLYEGA